MEKINWDEKLFRAIRNGDFNQAEEAIRNGGKVNAKNDFGWSPLHIAADRNDVKAGKMLTENGGDINAKDEEGYTPAMIAVLHGYVEFFEFSLNVGNNIDLQNKYGETQLIMAVKELIQPLNKPKSGRYIKIIEDLVEAKAKVKIKDKAGNTAVSLLEGKEEFKQVKEMLQKKLEEEQKAQKFPGIREIKKKIFNF